MALPGELGGASNRNTSTTRNTSTATTRNTYTPPAVVRNTYTPPAPVYTPPPVRYTPPAPVYTPPPRVVAPPVPTAPARATTPVVAPKPTAKDAVTTLLQGAARNVQQATQPATPGLPNGWGATANTRVTQPLYRQADPAYGEGMSEEGTPSPYKSATYAPVNADQYAYPTAPQSGVRATPELTPQQAAQAALAAAHRSGYILTGLTGFGHQAEPSESMYGPQNTRGVQNANGVTVYPNLSGPEYVPPAADPNRNLYDPSFGFMIPTSNTENGNGGWVFNADAGVDPETGYAYGYALDPQTGEWKPAKEVYDDRGFIELLDDGIYNTLAPVIETLLALTQGGAGYDSSGGSGYDSGYGGGGYGGGGGGSYGGGGGYADGGSGGSGGGSGGGTIGDATDTMDGWAARYSAAGAQEVLANPAVIATDTLTELGLGGSGMDALVGQQLTYMANQLLPFLYANTAVGETPNASDVINMLHDLAISMVSPSGQIIDVGTLMQRLLTKLDPNSIMGATFKGLTPGAQVSTAQNLLNGLSNFAPTAFMGNALRNYWATQGTDYLSQALRVTNPTTTPFNEFMGGFVYPGGS